MQVQCSEAGLMEHTSTGRRAPTGYSMWWTCAVEYVSP
eukprot:SAG11_NODE_26045_length_350_cov_1.270916_1_plen_37_part_10